MFRFGIILLTLCFLFPGMMIQCSDKNEENNDEEELTSIESQWNEGDRVFGNWNLDEYWYPGTIESISDGVYFIKYDDGDEQNADLPDLKPLELHIGQSVMARWNKGDEFYYGQITNIQNENLDIIYFVGAQETIPIHYIRIADTGQLQNLNQSEGELPADGKWDQGDPCLVKWYLDNYYYPAKIAEVYDNFYHIEFLDGDEQWCMANLILPDNISEGDEVQCIYPEHEGDERVYYYGQVNSRDQGKLNIHYNTGKDFDVDLSGCRLEVTP